MYIDEQNPPNTFQRRQQRFLSLIISGEGKYPSSAGTQKPDTPNFRWKTITACLIVLGAGATMMYLDKYKMAPAYIVPTLIESENAAARWEVKKNESAALSSAPPVIQLVTPGTIEEEKRHVNSASSIVAVPPLVLLEKQATKNYRPKHVGPGRIQRFTRSDRSYKRNTSATMPKRVSRDAASNFFKKKKHAVRAEVKRHETRPKRATRILITRTSVPDADVSLLEAVIRWSHVPAH